jgi:hypothetical protein
VICTVPQQDPEAVAYLVAEKLRDLEFAAPKQFSWQRVRGGALKADRNAGSHQFSISLPDFPGERGRKAATLNEINRIKRGIAKSIFSTGLRRKEFNLFVAPTKDANAVAIHFEPGFGEKVAAALADLRAREARTWPSRGPRRPQE